MAIELDYSIEVLEATPARVARFLQGMGAVAFIRTRLAHGGMTDDDIDEGRQLLLACLAERKATTPELDTEEAKATREAQAELDAWDEPNFARYSAALYRSARKAHDYVFEDLKASTGPESVKGVATFLARVDKLEKGVNGSPIITKKDDAKAMEVLVTRGLTRDERKRLKNLVDIALGPTTTLPEVPEADPDEERLLKLNALKAWFDDWSATARAVLKKRGYLIRLGLANRKAPKIEPTV